MELQDRFRSWMMDSSYTARGGVGVVCSCSCTPFVEDITNAEDYYKFMTISAPCVALSAIEFLKTVQKSAMQCVIQVRRCGSPPAVMLFQLIGSFCQKTIDRLDRKGMSKGLRPGRKLGYLKDGVRLRRLFKKQYYLRYTPLEFFSGRKRKETPAYWYSVYTLYKGVDQATHTAVRDDRILLNGFQSQCGVLAAFLDDPLFKTILFVTLFCDFCTMIKKTPVCDKRDVMGFLLNRYNCVENLLALAFKDGAETLIKNYDVYVPGNGRKGKTTRAKFARGHNSRKTNGLYYHHFIAYVTRWTKRGEPDRRERLTRLYKNKAYRESIATHFKHCFPLEFFGKQGL